ncbi:hypothetical protein PPTG_24455 [Phytophthora nicotianae INRA-310]|uniref:ZSWIM1/3 RNaseH-like domain-containing protein n=1 Tax=Phytophthora nicotianae (strain INRA-310) TaxID=761204 RepID=W2PDT7_PHYN3|nr:hypothetical protein PPTG_24455 [Phytophthora nicotianae INRA-310]ETM99227.1 hypothetical protein PPTG_24455 [Phytophthora nicotianae INRA-310]
MVTDKFGCGSFAQHALVDGGSKLNMLYAVRAFKQNNPAWVDVKVIVIDKDFIELGLLCEEFPCATIILCHFHVIDYLKRENESLFDEYLSALTKLCAGKPLFMDYFTENWLNCKDQWCTFKHGNIPHLANNTNNRLEASWGAAKDLLHRHMAMDECIDHLLFLQQTAEDQYTAKNESLFDEYLSALTKLCAGKPLFMDYFTENWLNCKDQWCTFKHGNIPHLANNTNNRLEASWGAAKDLLHRHMAMDECIDHLLFLQQTAEDQYTAKVKRVGFRYSQNYDEEMSMLAKLATHHACNLVEEQYLVSGRETYDTTPDENTPEFFFTLASAKSGGQYAVNLNTLAAALLTRPCCFLVDIYYIYGGTMRTCVPSFRMRRHLVGGCLPMKT